MIRQVPSTRILICDICNTETEEFSETVILRDYKSIKDSSSDEGYYYNEHINLDVCSKCVTFVHSYLTELPNVKRANV